MKTPKIYSILSKLLHDVPKNRYTPVEDTFKTFTSDFFDTKMDFYLRKVFKHNDIKYTWHRKERRLVVNYPGSPFKMFIVFDDNSNYITIRKIPWDNFEYQINAITMDQLFTKMIRYGILPNSILRRIIIPVHLQAEQLKLVF